MARDSLVCKSFGPLGFCANAHLGVRTLSYTCAHLLPVGSNDGNFEMHAPKSSWVLVSYFPSSLNLWTGV